MKNRQIPRLGFVLHSLAFAAGAVAVLALGQSPALAQEVVKVPVLQCPTGCGPTLAWQVAQERSSQWHPWLRIIGQDTPGYAYNLKYLAKTPSAWKTTIIGTGALIRWAAAIPLKPYFTEKVERSDYKILAVTGKSANMFLTFDTNILTPHDFKGKRLGMGTISQPEWGIHATMMLDGWGMLDGLKSLDRLGPRGNIDALLDGRTDIGITYIANDVEHKTVAPAGVLQKLVASGRDFNYVDVSAEMIEQVIKQTGGAPFDIVHYSMGQLPKQKRPVTTFGNLLYLEVHKTFPDDLAYEFVKFYVENAPKIAKYHAEGKIWTKTTITHTLKEDMENWHPGAIRAYKELGMF